jgi:hypothetical protein
MRKFLLSWLAIGTAGAAISTSIPPPLLLQPLASISVPSCSLRAGTRATQSGLVEFGDFSASLGAQAVREKAACDQSAALWVTQKGVSQQIDLTRAAIGRLSIVDVAPDFSAILISTTSAQPDPEDRSTQVGVVSLADSSVQWTPVREMLSVGNCDASFRPQGFLDPKHIEIATLPHPSSHSFTNCSTKVAFYSIALDIPRVKLLNTTLVVRRATAMPPPERSCKDDPDVAGACYSTRARLSLDGPGPDLLLWPVGAVHYMEAEQAMIPSNLRLVISQGARIYATVTICPLMREHRGPRPYVCVGTATDLRPELKSVKKESAASSRR